MIILHFAKLQKLKHADINSLLLYQVTDFNDYFCINILSIKYRMNFHSTVWIISVFWNHFGTKLESFKHRIGVILEPF